MSSDKSFIKAKDFNSRYQIVRPDLADKKVVMLIYRDTCPACAAFKPNFEQAKQVHEAKSNDVKYVKFDTEDQANSAMLDGLYDDKSKAPFTVPYVPMLIAYNKGKFYSIYGKSDGSDPMEPPYRSVEGVMYYADTIGTSPVTFKKD
jgi:thiol-disulfide isomerase/thioredoxin